MKRVKRRIFSGVVCEQIIYNVADNVKNIAKSKPRIRFKNEEEREAHRLEISRKKFVRMINSFDPTALYSTLTLDDEDEVHTFKEARRLRDNYVRRLTYHFPQAKIVIVMGRGKHTRRIHFHMISDGVPETEVRKLWGMGEVLRIDPLREHNYYNGIDYGRDYTGLANYLFDHWTPEQGGHRWKQTRNMKSGSEEKAKEVKRNYSVTNPPKPPKGYMLVESAATKYGYLYFKYVRIPEKKKSVKKGAA